MAPLRIGFLGLSAKSWATTAHLPFLLTSPDKYQIVALCNSSKQSAQAAVEQLKLPNPDSIRTYGSPADLAADPDIDLVVCSVRVDKHYDTLKPIIAAGRDCYCEWPLARNVQEAQELAALAREKKIKTVVGLQTRFFPGFRQARDLIQQGSIGRVLSSSIRSTSALLRSQMGVSAEYLNVLETGAFNIPFGHILELVMYVLGSWDQTQQLAQFTTEYKQIQLEGSDGSIVRTIERTVPDQVTLHARLPSEAVLSLYQRSQAPFKEGSGLFWRIQGTDGELEISSPNTYPAAFGGEVTLRHFDFKTDAVKTLEVDVHGGDGIFELQIAHPAKSVGRIYEAFRQGRTDEYADWERAVETHDLIDGALKGHEDKAHFRSLDSYNRSG